MRRLTLAAYARRRADDAAGASVIGCERLLAGLEINDAEPPMSQRHALVVGHPVALPACKIHVRVPVETL